MIAPAVHIAAQDWRPVFSKAINIAAFAVFLLHTVSLKYPMLNIGYPTKGKTGGASQEAPEAFGQVRQPVSYLPA